MDWLLMDRLLRAGLDEDGISPIHDPFQQSQTIGFDDGRRHIELTDDGCLIHNNDDLGTERSPSFSSFSS